MITYNDIKKDLSVTDFWMDKTGIGIEYKVKGVDYFLSLTAGQAAEQLQKSNSLSSFNVIDDQDVMVSYEWTQDGVDHSGSHKQQSGFKSCSWEEFAGEQPFCQRDAVDIAIRHELKKAIDGKVLYALRNKESLFEAFTSIAHPSNYGKL